MLPDTAAEPLTTPENTGLRAIISTGIPLQCAK
jgi:hypothetical protein